MSSNLSSISMTMAAADADGIFLSANPAADATLTLDGALVTSGVAILDIARRVAITSATDDSAIVFTITGTDRNGNTQSESILGANVGVSYTTKDYKTVTGITISGNAGTITIGTNGVASSKWIPTNHQRGKNIGFGVELSRANGVVTAVLNYSIQHTFNDLEARPQDAVPYLHPDVQNKTTEQDGNYAFGITGFRLHINEFTSGTATLNTVMGLGGGL